MKLPLGSKNFPPVNGTTMFVYSSRVTSYDSSRATQASMESSGDEYSATSSSPSPAALTASNTDLVTKSVRFSYDVDSSPVENNKPIQGAPAGKETKSAKRVPECEVAYC